jgi:sialic acid synthase SpsE
VAEEESKVFRRSLYLVKDLPDGHVIGAKDILRIRPGIELGPKYFDEVVGRTAKFKISAGQTVHIEDLV